MPVTLNGEGPFEFLLDTGATTTAIEPALARRLRLPPGRQESFGSIAGESVAERSHLDVLAIGSSRVVDVPVWVTPLGAIGRLGRVQGVLGTDVLGRNSFLLSYEKERLEFDHDGTLARRVNGIRTRVHLSDGRLQVEADVRGVARPISFVLDTGTLDVVIFEKAPGELNAALGTERSVLTAHTATGVRRLPTGILRDVRLASESLGNLQTLIVCDPGETGRRVEDGLLPANLFREVWFDRESGFLILNPGFTR